MRKILIIGSRNSGDKNDTKIIGSKLSDCETLDISLANWEDLIFDISKASQSVLINGANKDVSDFDLVMAFNWYKNGKLRIYRDVAFSVALYLKSNNVQFWNSEMADQRSATKLSAMMQLAINGYDIPRTIFALDGKLLKKQIVSITYPFIAKSVSASRGKDNYLIESIDEFENKISLNSTNKFVIQEYLPNDYDLRIICMGGEPIFAIKRSRSSENTHLNNTSQGGQSSSLELKVIDKGLLTKSQEICRIFKREMAGIDWLKTNDISGRTVCLEVNPIPQLTSGSLVDSKIDAIKYYLDNKAQE